MEGEALDGSVGVWKTSGQRQSAMPLAWAAQDALLQRCPRYMAPTKSCEYLLRCAVLSMHASRSAPSSAALLKQMLRTVHVRVER